MRYALALLLTTLLVATPAHASHLPSSAERPAHGQRVTGDDTAAILGLLPVDDDGHVPVVEVCDLDDTMLGEYRWYVDSLRYDEALGRYRAEGLIVLNMCRLESMAAGPNDVAAVLIHEWGHTRGYEHNWGTPQTNPSFYEGYFITGT